MYLATLVRGFSCILLLSNVILAQPYVISTIAGGTLPPSGISAANASLPLPAGIVADNSGNVYFTSNNTVFKVDLSGGLTRIAGNGRAGYSGNGGPATSAQLNEPHALALDSAGNLYIADSGNNSIRKVMPGGNITTIAGNGVAGYSGDGAAAISAQLDNPLGVAVDSAGNIYIADSYNQRVRKIVPVGIISTLAGDGTCCFSGDNGPANKAQLHQPESVAVDAGGNVYIADLGNNRVRKVSTAGTITTVAGNGSIGTAGDGAAATSAQLSIVWAVASDATGNLYIADTSRIRKVSGGNINTVAGGLASGYSGDGAVATRALLDGPVGVAVDSSGNLYIADTGNSRIRKVASNGNISTIAGDGTRNYSGDGAAATSAQIFSPQSLAFSAGNIYLTDYNRVRRIASNGVITTVAGNGTPGILGDNGGAVNAQLNQPTGIALDTSSGPNAGTLYIADTGNNRVRKVTPAGVISTIAGNGTAAYSGDGGPATSAQLSGPQGVAVDTAGNVYIADSGNGAIRKVNAAGTISTVAGTGVLGFSGEGGAATSAQLLLPRALTLDLAGNIYVADFGNDRVRKISTTGTITTVAGTGSSASASRIPDGVPATSVSLSPQGVAVDSAGNLLITDLNNLVWKVTADGNIAHIAGNGSFGYSGDGGSALNAQLSDVSGIALDSAGNIYLADTSNNAIRVLRSVAVLLSITTVSPLTPASVGMPYSQQLTASGGTAPLTWTIVGGTLPTGLTLSATGVISGTPTAAGTSSFTIQVTDSAGAIATQPLSLAVTLPAITTSSPLLQGSVGLTYSQTLTAFGGAPPYTWSIVSGALPVGLTLSPTGVIAGTPTVVGTSNFSVKLTDAAGNSTSASFTLNVVAAPPLARSGVLAHIAAGGTWSTTIYLANTSQNQVSVTISLHADDGTALVLPLNVTQQGSAQSVTASSVDAVMAPDSTLVIDMGQQVAATVTGWADVLSSGSLNGFAIFRTSSNGTTSEGTSPLQTQFGTRIDVPYDNRSGFVTAVALANLTASPATITATIFDPTGVQLGVQTLSLAANGHTSFLFPDQLPQTAGQQGIVEFRSSSGSLAGVGLRASPQGTFTSVPVIQP